MKKTDYKELLGKTFTSVENTQDQLVFTCETGEEYKFYHQQDCCESVEIEDIIGDLDHLVGSPLLMAEEVCNHDENPEGVPEKNYQDSFTWTFYKFATNRGAVTVRWYGESNGYYSESVDFMKVI